MNACAAARVGVEPVACVVLAENHDAAYYAWRDAGMRRRTLLHIDAHADMLQLEAKGDITIANFISAALRDDIVSAVTWVVPDPSWDGREPLLQCAAELARGYQGDSGPVRATENAITTTLREKPLTIVPLARLPAIEEPVLLDIDIDFMVIPRVLAAEQDRHADLPWCWPEDLLARLAACRVRSDLVTVVHSVEGGYTPLPWKYLGEELLRRLKDPNAPEIRAMRLIREGAEAETRGDPALAKSRFTEAAQRLPKSAAPLYRLARLAGQGEEAQALYRNACRLDPSYRTPFSSAGFVHLESRDWQAAEREFRAALQLDAEDPYATLGLASVAAQQENWEEAKGLVESSLAADPNLLDAQRLHGRILARLQRNDEALAAYERSLKLALAGQKSIAATIYTRTAQPRLFDPQYSQTMGEAAQLYEVRGDLARAVQFYRMCAAGGEARVKIRLRLARVYARQARWGKLLVQLGSAVRAASKNILQRLRRAERGSRA